MNIAAGFYDLTARTLADGRALAESRMDSVCKVFYESGRGAVNPVTGVQSPTFTNRATGVPCRVSSKHQVNGEDTSPAESLGSAVVREVHVPASTPQVFAGDFIELTTVGPLTDASLAGVRFRVVDPGMFSQGTARRMKVEVDL